MKLQEILQRMRPVWIAARHVAFWTKWAFCVLFVIPGVMLCGVLALYSHFSFATIPRDIYGAVANAQHRPAAPAGFLNVEQCEDPKTGEGAKPQSRVLCKTWGVAQRSIDSLAKDTEEKLWEFYLFAVFMGCGLVMVFGAFESSRNRFRAQTRETRHLAVR
ncbi:MAG: hypothetical protein RXR20_01055 [Paraburkholderia sp.]|uniref:hypothetical protein n=1 Tax=Burkholderiaceae TaxID=119060 RepID=UPI0010F49318|nr:hypothetical protein [Burkholderia sp. 4M9327F10]